MEGQQSKPKGIIKVSLEKHLFPKLQSERRIPYSMTPKAKEQLNLRLPESLVCPRNESVKRNFESTFKDCLKVQLPSHKKLMNNINNININLYQIIQKQEASRSPKMKIYSKRGTLEEERHMKKQSNKKVCLEDLPKSVQSQIKKARKKRNESDLYANYQFY